MTEVDRQSAWPIRWLVGVDPMTEVDRQDARNDARRVLSAVGVDPMTEVDRQLQVVERVPGAAPLSESIR